MRGQKLSYVQEDLLSQRILQAKTVLCMLVEGQYYVLQEYVFLTSEASERWFHPFHPGDVKRANHLGQPKETRRRNLFARPLYVWLRDFVQAWLPYITEARTYLHLKMKLSLYSYLGFCCPSSHGFSFYFKVLFKLVILHGLLSAPHPLGSLVDYG